MSWGAISLYLEGLYNLFRKKYKQKIITANFRDKTKLVGQHIKNHLFLLVVKKKVRQTYTTLFIRI